MSLSVGASCQLPAPITNACQVRLRELRQCDPGGTVAEHPPASAGDAEECIPIPGWEDPLEKERATHSSILAWEIPWTEEPGGPQSTGSKESDMHIHAL